MQPAAIVFKALRDYILVCAGCSGCAYVGFGSSTGAQLIWDATSSVLEDCRADVAG